MPRRFSERSVIGARRQRQPARRIVAHALDLRRRPVRGRRLEGDAREMPALGLQEVRGVPVSSVDVIRVGG